MASANAVMAGMAFVKLTLNDAELKNGLTKAQTRLQRFRAGVSAMSSQLTLMAPLIGAGFIGATKIFADFDDQMRLTAAVSGATSDALASMTEQAKKLGRETSFTAAQVASGMAALGRMGFKPAQIQAAIRPMMDLARATGTDLSVAAQIAANNLAVFKMRADQATEVADILAVTSNGSAQTLEDLGEALKMAAPQAARAGADLRETAAMLGVLANMGIRGSLAGTALGKSFKRMADPKVQQFLRDTGVEVLDANKELRKMQDILVDVAKAMARMTNAQQIAFAETVFDARGSLGGGTLSVNTEMIDVMMQKLADAQGAAAATAEEMDKGIGGSLRRLASAAEGISIAFGETLAKTFLPAIERASAFANVLTEVIKNSKMLGTALAYVGAATGIAVVLKIFMWLGAAVKALHAPIAILNGLLVKQAAGANAAAAATTRLNAALAWLAANPVTVALIALAAGIYACRKAVELSEEGFAREAEAAKAAAAAIEERRAAGDRQRSQHQDDFKRLQQLQELARQGKINDDQMREAASLAESLQNVYGDLGIAVDSATKSITMMAQAQERLNQAMREKALKELEEEIEQQKQVILKLGDSLAGGWRHFFTIDVLGKDTETDEYSTLFGIDSVAKHDAPIKKQMAEEREKLRKMYERLKALRSGDVGAITGAGTTSADRIAATTATLQQRSEVAGYTDFLKNRDARSASTAAGRALDKRFDVLAQDQTAAGRQAMADFMGTLGSGLAAARREYERRLQEARSEGSEGGEELSSNEKADLKRLQQTIDGMTDRIAGYRDRIADGMAQAQAQMKTVSGFDAVGLMRMFGRKSERELAAERTAKATEKSEKYLKELVAKSSQGFAIL